LEPSRGRCVFGFETNGTGHFLLQRRHRHGFHLPVTKKKPLWFVAIIMAMVAAMQMALGWML
jgi:hypothetical protein